MFVRTIHETYLKQPFSAIQSTTTNGTSLVVRRLRLGSVTADGLTALGPLAAQRLKVVSLQTADAPSPACPSGAERKPELLQVFAFGAQTHK